LKNRHSKRDRIVSYRVLQDDQSDAQRRRRRRRRRRRMN
jgi:hypothetical protein